MEHARSMSQIIAEYDDRQNAELRQLAEVNRDLLALYSLTVYYIGESSIVSLVSFSPPPSALDINLSSSRSALLYKLLQGEVRSWVKTFAEKPPSELERKYLDKIVKMLSPSRR